MVTRRGFLSAGGAAAAAGVSAAQDAGTPALLGGAPAHSGIFPPWPVFDAQEEKALLETLGSRKWLRVVGDRVNRFEREYAAAIGTKGCVATCNGTSALLLTLKALGVGPGDEVLAPPYTFVATINAVLALYALPVFVDTDRETAQMDARKIEAAITDRTAAILPVHLGGSPCDMDAILEIGKRRGLPVIEDACQAHFGEWRKRRLGSLGRAGCFSFQGTKNMACGEGGAVVSNDEALIEKCFALHSHGRTRTISGYNFQYQMAGANLRMDEFHAALASVQLTRVEQQAQKRERNAAYLTELLRGIPGVEPARMYEGCTRNAWHLYIFRYKPEAFAGMPRARFLRALSAERIPAGGGYAPLNQERFLTATLASRDFQSIYSKQRLEQWKERNHCPENEKLCGEAVWLTQRVLLGEKSDIEKVAAGIRKVHANAARLAKA
jgi:dTDP-4-amino-4,6-dideoxygalactose transaminase